MQLNRKLEDALTILFRQNKIVGGLYSSLGQRPSPSARLALEKRDWMAPMIRNVGALLVKGFAPRDIAMQYMAKKGSPTQGKDGTSHFGDLNDRHVVSPISMLGDLIPVMAGVGLAARYLGRNEVAMTWIGEGGSSTGAFHEGLNFAAVQKAPLVLILENNLWAYSTPTYLQAGLKDFADRARAYGIPAQRDGNDVLAAPMPRARSSEPAAATAPRSSKPKLRRRATPSTTPPTTSPTGCAKSGKPKTPSSLRELSDRKETWTEKRKRNWRASTANSKKSWPPPRPVPAPARRGRAGRLLRGRLPRNPRHLEALAGRSRRRATTSAVVRRPPPRSACFQQRRAGCKPRKK
jgi:hypothetical protein